MLSLDLRQAVSAFLAEYDSFVPLLDAIGQVAAFYDAGAQHVLALADGGDKLNQAAGTLHSRFASLPSVTRNIVPRKVYGALEALTSAAGKLEPELQQHAFLAQFMKGVEEFVGAYDSYLMNQSPGGAASLMLIASRLNRQVADVFAALHFITETLESKDDAGPPQAVLSLVLYQVRDIGDFAGKLAAFHSLHAEACLLLGTSPQEHPLRIAKIESGSLWIKVFGDTKITQLLAGIVESTLGFLHRQFTKEGKIAAVPRKFESLDSAIQISAKLQALGVDTTEMNDHLRKGAVSLSRNLATLLEDQPRIQLNERVLSVGERLEPLLLAQRETLLIVDGSQRVEPTLDGESPPPGGSAA